MSRPPPVSTRTGPLFPYTPLFLSQPVLAQPFDGRALLLAQRRVLQGLQRRQPAALFLRLLAHLGQFVLRGALLVLQLGDGLLALFEVRVEGVERSLLLLDRKSTRLNSSH